MTALLFLSVLINNRSYMTWRGWLGDLNVLTQWTVQYIAAIGKLTFPSAGVPTPNSVKTKNLNPTYFNYWSSEIEDSEIMIPDIKP